MKVISDKYQVVYADPAWKQLAGRKLDGYVVEDGKQVYPKGDNRSQELPYDTMSIEDICNIDVKSVIEKDCHLYIWVTNKYLLEAKRVIESWGFKYSTAIIWEKALMGGGLGGAFRVNSEFLLFCRRGSLKTMETIPATVHKVKRPYVNGYPVHSKKPDYFRKMIERVSPYKSLEMFAREKVSGWDVWGNEVEDSIIINSIK